MTNIFALQYMNRCWNNILSIHFQQYKIWWIMQILNFLLVLLVVTDVLPYSGDLSHFVIDTSQCSGMRVVFVLILMIARSSLLIRSALCKWLTASLLPETFWPWSWSRHTHYSIVLLPFNIIMLVLDEFSWPIS